MIARPVRSAREALRGGFAAAVVGALMCGANLLGLLQALRYAAEDPVGLAGQAFGVVVALLLLGYGTVTFRRGLGAIAPE